MILEGPSDKCISALEQHDSIRLVIAFKKLLDIDVDAFKCLPSCQHRYTWYWHPWTYLTALGLAGKITGDT